MIPERENRLLYCCRGCHNGNWCVVQCMEGFLMTGKRKYVVAGSGLAGLSAAIELASAGGEVVLCEQSRTPGGRAATHHQGGFAANLGPHGFYRAGAMKAQFDDWGIRVSGRVPLRDGKSVLIGRGKMHGFPTGAGALFWSTAFGFADKLRLARVLGALGEARARQGESMRSWIDRQGSERGARNMLGALTRLSTYAADLELLEAGFARRQVQMARRASVLYLDGGWQSLVEGLAQKARSLGAEIRTECGVASVRGVSVRGRAVVLRTGESIEADGVILAIPPRAVEQVTGCSLPPLAQARAACLDLGLRRLPGGAATFALGLDEATYLSVHSLYAKGLAPAGGALAQVAMYLGRGQSCSRDELEQRADLAMPGWRTEAVFSRFLPEMTVVHALPEPGRGRPDVDILRTMPGVMVAGDWVGPQGMLADAAVASGVRAARTLVSRPECPVV